MGLLDKLSDPYMLMQIMGGVGLLGSKRQSQADKYRDYMTKGLLGYAESQKKDGKQKQIQDALTAYQKTGDKNALGTTLSGIEGMESAGVGLLTKPDPARPTAKGKGGLLLYTDTGEAVPGQDGIVSPFDNPKEAIDTKLKIKGAYDDAIKPDIKRLKAFENVTTILNDKGGFDKLTGSDDTLLMKALAQAILPGEAVMSDDLQTIAQQGGLPSMFKNWVAKLTGDGQLEASDRAHIYDTMRPLYYESMRNAEHAKAGLFGTVKEGGFDYNDVFGVKPYMPAFPIPQPLLNTRPAKPRAPTTTQPRPDPVEADSIWKRMWR